MQVTRKLSEFVTSTDFDDLPLETIDEAKLCFMDWLGVTLAGVDHPEINKMLEVLMLIGGKEQASIIGKKIRTSVLNATLLNGTISHVLDFDDTCVEFLGHPSVTLFPGLLALSEWKGKSGREFLTAFVLGFEMGCRVALGATANHYLMGWHGTSTIGHFSSTAAMSKLLGLSTEQLVYALGIAGTQASGLKAVFGTSCKPLHAGKAGFDGLLSVLLAQEGFTSVKDILEGEKCFWDMYSTNWDGDQALKELGKRWYITGNKYKFHASCYETHAPVEAVLAIKKEHDIKPGAIDRIDVDVPAAMMKVAGKQRPENGLEAKFSIPFCVANAIIWDETGLRAFTDERVNDTELVKLRDKVEMIPNDKIGPFEAHVVVHAGSRKYEARFDMLAYTPSQGEKTEKVLRKFLSLARPVLRSDHVEELVSRLKNLEQENNMADLTRLMASITN